MAKLFADLFWVIVPFLIMLGVLIFVHEFGHFISAKLFRVKVLVFAFGLGPRIFFKKIGETEYGINLFPFGGLVQLFGDPTERDEKGLEKISPEEEKRALYAQSAWKRFIIFSGGSLMNIFLAFAVMPMVYWIGIERSYFEVAEPRVGAILAGSAAETAGIKPGDLILEINHKRIKDFKSLMVMEMLNANQELTYTIQRGSTIFEERIRLEATKDQHVGYSGIFLPGTEPVIGAVYKSSPAEKAGIIADDKILSVNGKEVHYWHELTGLIQASGGSAVELLVQRGEERVLVSVKPEYRAEDKKFLLGIELKEPRLFVRYGFVQGLGEGIKSTYHWGALTIITIGKLFKGQLSVKAVSGPVGIAGVTSQAAKLGISHFLLLLVIISINLGILNLIPIPPLDGAHILVLGIEAVIRRELNRKVKELIFQTTFFLLIGLMLIITFNDFIRYQEEIGDWFRELLRSFGIK